MSTKQTNSNDKKKKSTANKTPKQKSVVAKPKNTTKTNIKANTKQKNKKNTKTSVQLKKEINTSNNEIIRLIKIIIIITIIMALIYVVTIFATKKADEVKSNDTTTSEQTTQTEIQYDNIMIGTMLNKGGTYYVLIEENTKDDQRIDEYDMLITIIKNTEDAPTIYKADLTDAFNKVYKAKESNYYVDNISDFKVTGTTLVKIEDAKIVSAVDDYDGIKKELNNLK